MAEAKSNFFWGLLDLWPQALAGYGKIFTEEAYDTFFRTKMGEKLKGLSKTQKHLLGAFFILLTAVIEKRFPEDTNWRKFTSEIWKDTAPEVYRRMMMSANEFLESHPDIEGAIVSKKIEKGESFLKLQFGELEKTLKGMTEKMNNESLRLKEKRQRRSIWKLF